MARKKADQQPSLLARLIVGAALLVVFAGGLGAASVGGHYAMWTSQTMLPPGRAVSVVIPRGTSWSGVVSILTEAGVVSNPWYFEFWGRRKELPSRVKAGAYTFEGPLTLDDLYATLQRGGSVEEVQVTLPEGFTIFHMADRLAEHGLVSRDAFLRAARDREALDAAGITGDSFEGYLFPDTYRFRQATPAPEIVSRMHERWKQIWGELGAASPDALAARQKDGLSREDLVTLASIVERESAEAKERPLIARVFYNRLATGMRLQSDPTCVYGEATYDQVPSPATCKDPNNPYSTYVVKRLPPGPIANPGRGALEAVLKPASDEGAEKFLYFVAKRDGTGAHHFSETLEEHNAAVKKYLKP